MILKGSAKKAIKYLIDQPSGTVALRLTAKCIPAQIGRLIEMQWYHQTDQCQHSKYYESGIRTGLRSDWTLRCTCLGYSRLEANRQQMSAAHEHYLHMWLL